MNYAQLTDSAKATALDECREFQTSDSEWFDHCYDMAKDAGKLFGLDIDSIYFSGFWSQGDGASFESDYAYRSGAARLVRSEFPQWVELHKIVERLQAIQRKNFYGLTAQTFQSYGSNFYSHSGTMGVDVYRDCEMTPDSEDEVLQCLREFADEIYAMLEREYEYLTSDESVTEMIEANGYEFEESGRLV